MADLRRVIEHKTSGIRNSNVIRLHRDTDATSF